MDNAEALFVAIEDYVRRAVAPLVARVKELEMQVTAIPAGPKGDTGERGEKGEAGERGERGLPGERGEQGIAGASGKDGERGADGKDGIAGKDAVVEYERIYDHLGELTALAAAKEFAKFVQPKDGAPGRDGRDGAPGRDGKDGERGPAGDRGEKGADGRDGANGERGADGSPGPQGDAGRDGKSIELSDVEPLISRAVAAELAVATKNLNCTVDEDAIVERVIARVPTGKDGAPGADGVPGKDGESIHPDTVRVMVQETVEKAIGSIRVPKDGEPGRDAAELDILDALSAAKSYPAGTFARHDGGILRAFRDTDPLENVSELEAAGWRVAQDGIKAIRAESVDDITHRLVVERTSGKADAVEFLTSLANMDKGVYRPGMKYLAGSGVTFDESYWIARRDTQNSPPGEDWRLILKGKKRP